MPRHAKPKLSSAATLIANIEATGVELIRQAAFADTFNRAAGTQTVPRAVMLSVIQECSALYASLFEHIGTIEQALEVKAATADQSKPTLDR